MLYGTGLISAIMYGSNILVVILYVVAFSIIFCGVYFLFKNGGKTSNKKKKLL